MNLTWCPLQQYDAPIPLYKLISTFKGFEDVEQKFEIAAGYKPLETGKHVYIDVKLFETKTGLPLIASNTVNPLRMIYMPHSHFHQRNLITRF
jgi:hypothetical protein